MMNRINMVLDYTTGDIAVTVSNDNLIDLMGVMTTLTICMKNRCTITAVDVDYCYFAINKYVEEIDDAIYREYKFVPTKEETEYDELGNISKVVWSYIPV